ncbi:hypothetical protein, partial [Desulfuromonas sp. CSMB_57]|uniref:hypothetical protein n=1 Tax=Desulfuromonas sp. CSMB_57 TaxID=2807629 RepID=UPI0020BD9FD3
MNADKGKVTGKGKFYHPLRSRHGGHRGKTGENLKAWSLGLNPKKGSRVKILSVSICVHLRLKKMVGFAFLRLLLRVLCASSEAGGEIG